MQRALIIGSGPAAAGAALALCNREDLQISVIDLGLQLEPDRERTVEALAATDHESWDAHDVAEIAGQPVRSGSGSLPQKRAYGSDFPFRDIGQLEGLTTPGGANGSVISPAYGGFSSVWGAQVMPFATSVFDHWPVSAAEMEPHYRAVLGEIPYAAEVDDLAPLFPLIGRPMDLPPPSARSARVLAAYARHRSAMNRLGVAVGKARLAFNADACVRCGLCLTGCPYDLIYSAAQTFDRLRGEQRVTYRSGLLALRLEEDGDQAIVTAREIATGRTERFEADRVYVACGGIGTTRLVAGSLGLLGEELTMLESQQFSLPFLSLRRTPDPRREALFTLNQFNLTVALDDEGFDLAQLHFYTFNSAFSDALPTPLRARIAEPARKELLRRLSFALGYLPSWRSPAVSVRISPTMRDGALPEMSISRGAVPSGRNAMMRTIVARLLRSAPRLDLYPVLPMLRLSAAAKSYHYGGSFPHAVDAPARLHSDRTGRTGPWQRIHLVDASVFPSVPATTFTLTVMANAHRIATETLALPQ